MPQIPENLLIEGRISDFKKNYASQLAPATIDYVIANDPSKNQKYLQWIGKMLVAANEDDDYISPQEMMKDIALFHKNIKGVDLYSLKSFDQLQSLVHKPTTPTSRQQIIKDAAILVNDKNWLVVAPHTHDASMFFGGGTRWCISTSSESHWNHHYNENGEAIIMIKNRKKSKGSADWKMCITVEPGDDNLDYAYMYDVNDHGSSITNTSFYSVVPEYVISKINDYLDTEHDGESRMQKYLEEKEEAEIEKYMQKDAINDTLNDYIKLMKKRYPKYNTKFDEDDLKDFLIEFVGEEIMNSMCRHIVLAAIYEHGWDDMYIRDLNQFDKFLFSDNPENASFFNYGLVSYINKVMGVEYLLNIVENTIGTKNFDSIDSNYELTDALTDCITKYATAINQSNQLTFPDFPHTNERFKGYYIEDVINLLNRYGYTQMADIIKSYSVKKLQEAHYKQFVVFML